MPNGELIKISVLLPKELDDLVTFIQKEEIILSKSALIRDLIRAGIVTLYPGVVEKYKNEPKSK